MPNSWGLGGGERGDNRTGSNNPMLHMATIGHLHITSIVFPGGRERRLLPSPVISQSASTVNEDYVSLSHQLSCLNVRPVAIVPGQPGCRLYHYYCAFTAHQQALADRLTGCQGWGALYVRVVPSPLFTLPILHLHIQHRSPSISLTPKLLNPLPPHRSPDFPTPNRKS